MDLMYLNATLNSEDYPPKDPWLAGEQASYYYFGYLQSGVLTAVSGRPAFDRIQPLARVHVRRGRLGSRLRSALRPRRAGCWAHGRGTGRWPPAASRGACCCSWGRSRRCSNGRPHTGTTTGASTRPSAWSGDPAATPQATDDCYSGAARTRGRPSGTPRNSGSGGAATRIIPDTITEFPVLQLPARRPSPARDVDPACACSSGTLGGDLARPQRPRLANARTGALPSVAIAVLLGALAFQNAWDVITFTLVLRARGARPKRSAALAWPRRLAARRYVGTDRRRRVDPLPPVGPDFSSQAEGIQPYVGAGTRPAHLLLQFGAILIAGLARIGPVVARR